ncbi:NUAK family SNF1-like kinase 2 [Diabrotica virgifera virgifera]|uniref:NUAK family SNF1-like kinase 2 n=1 Tax=Diabrotica virgifera virgifera TaxID=50390 RepID=A0A6P7FBZ3_DIAVI|nr:NUAK family SNF1-like kinase 2 [Diabrotica virgifera virgifera]
MTLDKKRVISVSNYVFTGNVLGKGNFARVEEAVHTKLNVKVAIKIIDINNIKEDYVLKNLYREAKIIAKLNHPCIVSVFETMQRSDNVYYLVTELANGGDLCAFVKKQPNGKLGEKQTKAYARQFSSALSHMHNQKVVHRDLKMENVMLNSLQTQIKIVDFGLSNFWNIDNPLRTHCGSPEYAAPELFVTGKRYGTEVDLWSFGIILYGMLVGQLPFVTCRSTQLSSQEKRKQLITQINKGLNSAHRKSLSTFSTDFRSLISQLLVADFSKRMTTKELIVHSWITDKGTKIICSNPIQELDTYEKSKILGKISTALQLQPKVVSRAISHEMLGKIGGMYNILKRHCQLRRLQGDGTSKTIQSLTILELTHLARTLEKDKAAFSNKNTILNFIKKPQSAQPQIIKAECVPKISVGDGERIKPTSSCTSKSPEQIKSTTEKKIQTKIRPNTVQEMINPRRINTSVDDNTRTLHQRSAPIDYRSIQCPSLRRKVYSATITNRIYSQIKNPDTNSIPSAKLYEKKDSSLTSAKAEHNFDSALKNCIQKDSVVREKIKKHLPFLLDRTKDNKSKDGSHSPKSKDKKLYSKMETKRNDDLKTVKKQLINIIKPSTAKKTQMVTTCLSRETCLRPDSSPANIRSKSQQTSKRRPVSRPLHQILEKSLQNNAILSKTVDLKQTKNQQYSKSASSASKERNNLSKIIKDFNDPNMASTAHGDYDIRATSSGHRRKLPIYDPIARSIADYVSNNVSGRMYQYPWVKK